MAERSPLVSTDWLAQALGAPDLVVLDGSWYLPAMKRDPKAEYEAGHIPGALFFDLEEMSDKASALPHMLPSTEEFAAKIGALGVSSSDRVIVYDGAGLFSAARIWWMFRVMGHDAVCVLDGGLPKWRRDDHPLEEGIATRGSRRFTAKLRPELLRRHGQIADNLATKRETVIDARAAARFAGAEAEPRIGLRAGHIPASRNVPWSALLAPDGTLLQPPEIEAQFGAAGVDLKAPLVTSCGSGVSACTLALALEVIGVKDVPVYDGSWAEWGANQSLPIATGPA